MGKSAKKDNQDESKGLDDPTVKRVVDVLKPEIQQYVKNSTDPLRDAIESVNNSIKTMHEEMRAAIKESNPTPQIAKTNPNNLKGGVMEIGKMFDPNFNVSDQDMDNITKSLNNLQQNYSGAAQQNLDGSVGFNPQIAIANLQVLAELLKTFQQIMNPQSTTANIVQETIMRRGLYSFAGDRAFALGKWKNMVADKSMDEETYKKLLAYDQAMFMPLDMYVASLSAQNQQNK